MIHMLTSHGQIYRFFYDSTIFKNPHQPASSSSPIVVKAAAAAANDNVNKQWTRMNNMKTKFAMCIQCNIDTPQLWFFNECGINVRFSKTLSENQIERTSGVLHILSMQIHTSGLFCSVHPNEWNLIPNVTDSKQV